MKSKDINNMEKKDITAKTLTVSEETREIYMINRELQQVQDKLFEWYESLYGDSNDKETNNMIMGRYSDEADRAFKQAFNFLDKLMEGCIIENLYSDKWEL